jgi:endonuclease IV
MRIISAKEAAELSDWLQSYSEEAESIFSTIERNITHPDHTECFTTLSNASRRCLEILGYKVEDVVRDENGRIVKDGLVNMEGKTSYVRVSFSHLKRTIKPKR